MSHAAIQRVLGASQAVFTSVASVRSWRPFMVRAAHRTYTTALQPADRSLHSSHSSLLCYLLTHSTYIPHLSSVVVFGGSTREARFYNDVYLYNLATNTWTHPATSPTRPPPRSGHTAVQYGNTLLVYGGQHIRLPVSQHANPTVTFYSDVWQLDLTSFEWRNCPLKGSTLPTRNGHTAWMRGGSMWMVGGSDESGPTGSVWRLDVSEWQWYEVDVKHGECGEWDGRELHGMAVEESGERVWLCGGRSENGVLNTRHALQLTDTGAAWSSTNSAPARCAHSLLTLHPNHTTPTATQRAADSEGEAKQQLSAAVDSLSLTRQTVPSLLLFGGTDGLTFYNDITVLSPPTLSAATAATVCPTCNGPIGCQRLGGGAKADNKPPTTPAATDHEQTIDTNGSKKGKKGKKRTKGSVISWPAHRFAHSLTAVQLRDGRAGYMLFGGMDEECDMNDAHLLTIDVQRNQPTAAAVQ